MERKKAFVIQLKEILDILLIADNANVKKGTKNAQNPNLIFNLIFILIVKFWNVMAFDKNWRNRIYWKPKLTIIKFVLICPIGFGFGLKILIKKIVKM